MFLNSTTTIFLCLSSLFVWSSPSMAWDCGQTQPKLADKIKDCSNKPDSTFISKSGVKWQLVARWPGYAVQYVPRRFEVWQDTKTGLVWGDVLNNTLGDRRAGTNRYHHQAITHGQDCRNTSSNQVECNVTWSACEDKDGIEANAGITDRKFGIPTVPEYLVAEKHGIREIHQMKDLLHGFYFLAFWTKTLKPDSNAFIFNGNDGTVQDALVHFTTVASVRCVGRKP